MTYYPDKGPSRNQLSGSERSNYEAIIKLQSQVAEIKRRCCCGNGFALTTLNPPVDAPVGNEPQVLFNVTEGILFYWDGDSWETMTSASVVGITALSPPVAAPVDDEPVVLVNLSSGLIYYWDGDSWEIASGDTNIATTDLTFGANRTHDLVSFVLKFLGQVGASFDIEITGPSGVHKFHVDEDDVRMRAEQSATQYSYVDVNVLDTTIEARNNSLRHFLEVYPTYVRLMSGVAGVDGVIRVDANAVFLYSLAGVYKFDKGDGTLALPSVSDVTPTHGLGVNASDGRIYRMTKPLIASDIANMKKDQIGLIIDGGGSDITTGVKGYIRVPFACTVTGWTIVESSGTPISSSIVIDVWKDTYANYPPTVADTIAGSEKPTLSTATQNQDLSLSTWTTALAEGDMLGFSVESVTGAQRIALLLHVTLT